MLMPAITKWLVKHAEWVRIKKNNHFYRIDIAIWKTLQYIIKIKTKENGRQQNEDEIGKRRSALKTFFFNRLAHPLSYSEAFPIFMLI